MHNLTKYFFVIAVFAFPFAVHAMHVLPVASMPIPEIIYPKSFSELSKGEVGTVCFAGLYLGARLILVSKDSGLSDVERIGRAASSFSQAQTWLQYVKDLGFSSKDFKKLSRQVYDGLINFDDAEVAYCSRTAVLKFEEMSPSEKGVSTREAANLLKWAAEADKVDLSPALNR